MAEEPSLDAIEAEPAPAYIDEIELDEEAFFIAASKQLELESRKQDIELRGKFSRRIFSLIVVWLLIVLMIVIFEGFHTTICTHDFKLSDNVLLALIGSTTANVLGVFIIVVHYLFPDSPKGP
jgi:hypothetical protein